jgi:hypothetical protein
LLWDADARKYLAQHRKRAVRAAAESKDVRWHPNGFVVFRIGDAGSLGQLRLHVWPKGDRRGVAGHPEIHSHNWDLASLVLAGTYTDELYAFDDDAEHFHAHAVSYDGGGDSLTPTGDQVGMRRDATREVAQGSFHFIPAGVPHRTRIDPGDLVVTLVVMGPLRPLEMVVAGPAPFSMYRRIRETPDDVALTDIRGILTDL